MEISTPNPPVTIHEVQIKVTALEAGFVSGLLSLVLEDPKHENKWSIELIEKMRDAFLAIHDREHPIN